MRTAIVALSLTLTLTLTSCTLYPKVPNETPEKLAQKGRADPYTYFDVDDTRNMVRGLRILLDEGATKKRNADTVLKEISFYGTLVLVGGTLDESIAARNIGGGSAGLASIFSNHYGVKVQRAAFTRAARQARCLEDAMRPIAPEVRILFSSTFDDDSDLAKKYYAIPNVTFDAVTKLRINLEAELDGVALGAPSVTEVMDIFSKLKEQEDTAKKKEATLEAETLENANKIFAALGAVPDACALPAGERTKDGAKLCAKQELLKVSDLEKQDRKRHFIIGVETYAQTVAACSVTKQ